MPSNMRSSKTSLPLEDSWGIVNTSDSSQEDEVLEDSFEKRIKAQRPISQAGTNPEPELIMPSIGNNAMDGSRILDYQRARSSTPRSEDSPSGVRSRRNGLRATPNPISPKRRSQRNFERQTGEMRQASPRSRNAGRSPSIKPVNTFAILSWFIDIFVGAFKILRYPITFALAIWMFVGLLILGQNFIMYSVEMALSPLCRVPLLSILNPSCPVLHKEARDGKPIAFDEAVAAQSNFEELMEQATTPSNLQLPREMKAGERLIRDLYQLVDNSEINSKNELLMELDRYIRISMHTTEGLTRFNGHIGAAVDHVLAMSRYTLRVLDGFQIQQESRGTIGQYLGGLLTPFQPIKFTEDLLFDQFIEYTKAIEDEITKLLVDAEDLQLQLNLMESSTDTIGGIAYRDTKHANAQRDEIYSWLWTRVGGNRGRIGKINDEIDFLRKITFDRKSAAVHISTTILRLMDTKTQLENLRSRLASPDLIRESKPLSVHIETIMAGAERLEDKRQLARDRELSFIMSPKGKDAKAPLELGSSRSR